MSDQSLRNFLKKQCESSGLGQREIARRAGMRQQTLNKYLNGGGMRSANLDALLGVFGLELHHKKIVKKK